MDPHRNFTPGVRVQQDAARMTTTTVGEQAQLLSVSFDGLKIAAGVLMGSDKSVSHKIFVSINLSTPPGKTGPSLIP